MNMKMFYQQNESCRRKQWYGCGPPSEPALKAQHVVGDIVLNLS
jgi:hypothetical protein